ncbi:MAG TPA: helix-turn-helix domain-containing protein [Anaerolineales bacterium]|nr:helix-turn-helix domain-containing protein [Anaerolineales bacterium]
MSMTPLGDWLTSKEAAELTGYNIQHIRRLARAGKVKTQKFGDIWMIGRVSLLTYLEEEGIAPELRRKKSKP